MTLILVVFFGMLFKDIVGTANMVFLTEAKPLFAGIADMLSDWFSTMSLGVGGVTLVSHGFSALTVGVFISMGAASILGTLIGFAVTKMVTKKAENGKPPARKDGRGADRVGAASIGGP